MLPPPRHRAAPEQQPNGCAPAQNAHSAVPARARTAPQAYRQQQEIGRQLKAARRSATQLGAQTAKLAAAAEQLEAAALTFGDLENYLAVIEGELGAVASALARVQRQQQAQLEEARQQRSGAQQVQAVAGRRSR